MTGIGTIGLQTFPRDHRYTVREMRKVMHGLSSYAFQYGLVAVSPFHVEHRALSGHETGRREFAFDGWESWGTLAGLPKAIESLQKAKAPAAAHVGVWLALREAGFRPVVRGSKTSWAFLEGTVPLDYLHEVEPLPVRRAIATISRWTWCRHCDRALAVTAMGFCEHCHHTPTGRLGYEPAPVGADPDYRPEVSL